MERQERFNMDIVPKAIRYFEPKLKPIQSSRVDISKYKIEISKNKMKTTKQLNLETLDQA